MVDVPRVDVHPRVDTTSILPHVPVAHALGSLQDQVNSSIVKKVSCHLRGTPRNTFISDTAFMSVLLMPSASPRSSKPFANSGRFNCPLAARPNDPRLLYPDSGGVERVSDALFRRPLGRPLRLRGAGGGGSGTSTGRLSRLQFSKTIDTPVAAVGDI